MKSYGEKASPAEGVVYWSGIIEREECFITCAIAPDAEVTKYGIATSHKANADFLDYISDADLLYLAQVHSHPSFSVDHSRVDDEETAFRSEGLLSIVVPHFSRKGMLPLKKCGIHRYEAGFQRLADKYISSHFKVKKIENVYLKDFRHGY